jgi:hypothetical protein
MRINFIKYLLFLFICFALSTAAQTNLDIISGFNDSLCAKVKTEPGITYAKVFLQDGFSSDYSYFYNKTAAGLSGLSLINNKPFNCSKDSVILYYYIDKINVFYGEIFRKKFLGDFYVCRNIVFNAGYSINGEKVLQKTAQYKFADTVRVDEIKKYETDPFIFTKGEAPKEYVYPTLLEPVIALGISAAVIILFFTIRSK